MQDMSVINCSRAIRYSNGQPVYLYPRPLRKVLAGRVSILACDSSQPWYRVMGDRDWRPFIYGGLASCTAECGTFPIDTTKTRLQIQGQKIDGQHVRLKYRGMTDAFMQIARQEGFRALYSGIYPAVIRQATYGTIKFGTYYSLKAWLTGDRAEDDVLVNMSCAVVAGIVSSAIANPTDVLKVRMQVLGVQAQSLVCAVQDLYRHEGVSGLWRGVGPTAQRAAVIAAVELPVYDFSKHYFIPYLGDSVSNHFLSSFLASLGAAIASTPIDVIRTRLMNQKKLKQTQTNNIYNGSMDCLVQTVRHEGFKALYKGFIPTWVRMGPWNIIFFVTYEQLKRFY